MPCTEPVRVEGLAPSLTGRPGARTPRPGRSRPRQKRADAARDQFLHFDGPLPSPPACARPADPGEPARGGWSRRCAAGGVPLLPAVAMRRNPAACRVGNTMEKADRIQGTIRGQ